MKKLMTAAVTSITITSGLNKTLLANTDNNAVNKAMSATTSAHLKLMPVNDDWSATLKAA
jgi:hypothetical protein